MATITTRSGKGSPLTNNEVDANFTNLNTDKAELSGATFTGAITANAGVVVDNITIDGNEIDVGSGDLTLDVAGDIILDTGGDDIKFKVGGTDFGSITYSNSNLCLTSAVSNGDILFKGNDGGSTITALSLDMSAGGTAYFADDVRLTDNHAIRLGTDGDIVFYHDNSNGYLENGTGNLTLDVAGDIVLNADGGDWLFNDGSVTLGSIQNDGNNNLIVMSNTNDKDIKFLGIDNSSTITALTLDMSAAGAATFNSTIAATRADLRNTSSGAETTALSLRNYAAGANTATALNFYPTQSTARFASIVAENLDGNNNIALSFLTSAGDTPTAALTLDQNRNATFSGSVSATGDIQAKAGNELRVYRTDNATYGSIEYLTGAGGLKLRDVNGDGMTFAGATSNYLTIASNGNVNIPNGSLMVGSTTAPSYRLDTESASGTDTVASFRNPSTSWGEYALARFQTDAKDTRFVELGYYRGTSESNRAFIINGQSSNRLLTIDESSGNATFSGSVTADELTVSKTASGSTTRIASFVNPVGHANTGVRVWMSGTDTTNRGTFIDAVAESTSNNHTLRFGTSASSALPVERMRIGDTGDISFYDGSANQGFFWDSSASSLGIGVTNVGTKLDITTEANKAGLRITAPNTTNQSFGATIAAGTSASDYALNVNNAAGSSTLFKVKGDGSSVFSGSVTADDFYTAASGEVRAYRPSGGSFYASLYMDSGETAHLYNSWGGKKLSFTRDGNLLVGLSSTSGIATGSTADNGVYVDGTEGAVVAQSSANKNLYLSKASGYSDPDFISFQVNGTSVGKIGTTGGKLHIDGPANNSGLRFHESSLIPRKNGDVTNGQVDLGYNDGSTILGFRNLTLSGGVYLGGTGSANKLDDYEEGTFTPTVFGSTTVGTATYSYQKGVYIKVGDLVHVQIYLNWSGGTGAGNLQFSGLPFTLFASSGYYGSASIAEASGIAGTAGHQLGGLGVPNANTINWLEFDFNSAPTGLAYDAAGYIVCSMSYRAV
jgi:hypothetical protein